ncbi:unnamed protein product [Amaranthus hypochondriacus]
MVGGDVSWVVCSVPFSGVVLFIFPVGLGVSLRGRWFSLKSSMVRWFPASGSWNLILRIYFGEFADGFCSSCSSFWCPSL